MARLAFLISSVVAGVLLGAIILGVGGRIVMRLLAMAIERPGVFSVGGSLEVVAYGGIVGAAGGLLNAVLPHGRLGPLGRGLGIGLFTYAGTILTLPNHIAATAAPFAERMILVHSLFGAIFLAFGIAVNALFRFAWFAKGYDRH